MLPYFWRFRQTSGENRYLQQQAVPWIRWARFAFLFCVPLLWLGAPSTVAGQAEEPQSIPVSLTEWAIDMPTSLPPGPVM